jgi:NADH-quinone oxidoreductase subunit I
MFGKGLIKGLSITIKRFFSKKVTEKYPEVKPSLPERSHGSFDYVAEKCISCELCVNACPSRVIKVNYHKNEQGKKVLDNYEMDLSYCLFCGLCIEACPTKCLNSKPDFELACFSKEDTVFSWEGNKEEDKMDLTTDAADEAASVK